MTMFILFLLFLFCFGLFWGSFLNVLIDRIPRKEGFVTGRSHCESCHKVLAWFDLIPLFSYFLLSGRCRYCHKKLSIYYPIIELVTASLFVIGAAVIFSQDYLLLSPVLLVITFLYYLVVLSSLIVIFFTDFRYGIIPFLIVFPTIAVIICYLLLSDPSSFLSHVLSALGAFLFFYFIFLLTRGKGMGFGDVVFSFLIGLLLGFPGVIIGLYIAFLTGAFVSLILVLLRRKRLKGGTISFGPFLVLGTILVFFFYQNIAALILPFFHL